MSKYKDIADLIDEGIEALETARAAIEEMAQEMAILKASLLSGHVCKPPDAPSDETFAQGRQIIP